MDPQQIEGFFARFLLPLVNGDQVEVGGPLGGPELDILTGEVLAESSVVSEVERACRLRLAELCADPRPCRLDRQALRLAVGAHDLLFCVHPDYTGGKARASTRRRLHGFIERCFADNTPKTKRNIFFHHVLVGNILQLTREDIEVGFWAGHRRFVGQTPPDRLLWWPDLRRVKVNREQTPWQVDLPEPLVPLLRRFLRQTPLTDLLLPSRSLPRFDWLDVHRSLAHRGVCRLVCYRYLEEGLTRVESALAEAFWQLVNAANPSQEHQDAARMAAGLVIHLFALQLLGHGAGEVPEISATIRSDTGQNPLEIVLWAAAQCGLLPPDEVWADPQLAERLKLRVQRAGASCNEIDETRAAHLGDLLSGRTSPPRLVSGRMVSGTLQTAEIQPTDNDITGSLPPHDHESGG